MVLQKVDPKALQQELELLWMYNLQWAFLEAKAKKQLKDQEKQAMVSIIIPSPQPTLQTVFVMCVWRGGVGVYCFHVVAMSICRSFFPSTTFWSIPRCLISTAYWQFLVLYGHRSQY